MLDFAPIFYIEDCTQCWFKNHLYADFCTNFWHIGLHQILNHKIIYMQNFASIFDFISIHCTNFQHTWFAPNFDSKIIYIQNFAPIFDRKVCTKFWLKKSSVCGILHQFLTLFQFTAPIFDVHGLHPILTKKSSICGILHQFLTSFQFNGH